MRPGERRRSEKLDREIAVRHGVDRVGGRPVKAKRGGCQIAVYRKGGAGKRRGAERGFVQTTPAIGKPAAVAPHHLDIGQQVMAKGHRLSDLQMGKAGHHPIGICLGPLDQRALQFLQRRIDAIDRIAYPQAEIGRDLVVA